MSLLDPLIWRRSMQTLFPCLDTQKSSKTTIFVYYINLKQYKNIDKYLTHLLKKMDISRQTQLYIILITWMLSYFFLNHWMSQDHDILVLYLFWVILSSDILSLFLFLFYSLILIALESQSLRLVFR